MNGNDPNDGNHPWRALVSDETYQCLRRSIDAAVVRHYQVNLIPGLCQTAEYTQALMAGTFGSSAEQVAGFLSLRAEYRRLLAAQRPRIRVIVDEAAVRREIGDADVMRRQVRELIDLATGDRVELAVLPFALGAHVGLRGSFVHLEADQGSGPDSIYREVDGLDTLETGEPSDRYRQDFDRLWQDALREDQLVRFLGSLWSPAP